MQNKGMIRTFAIVLALVCLYHLSFTYFTKKVESDAKAFANGDVEKEMAYLDSIANQPVYSFLFIKDYTYMDCKSSEINFGLDLKGGMNIVLEVKVSDIVKALSGNSTNSTFVKAVETAVEKEKSSTSDFITLFQEAFESLDPNAQLSTIFSTVELRDRIKNNMSNNEVISVLREETEAAISNAFNVLRTRIDRFGVTQPNIQRLEKAGRVLVELPGVTDPKRVRKLLQGTANLEFWETYNNDEIINSILEADVATREVISQNVAKPDTAEVDSTLALLGVNAVDSLQAVETYRSLSTYLRLMPAGYGPVVGVALAKDTKVVDEYINSDKVRRILPRDLKLIWTVKPLTGKQAQSFFPDKQLNEKEAVYQLVAIKQSSNNGKAPLEGDVITNARHNVSQNGASYEVSMNMNSEGTRKWANLTKANLGKSIAIVLDGFVYSFPTVQSEITGGSSQITGDFTPEEAQDLANVLKSGKLPAPATIVADNVVGPSLGQEAIESGLWSFLLAFIVVLIYMIVFYGFKAGGVADFALICNLFFIVGVLASFGAVLTLPGIAGIVLTIGMAVDANVIIYERIREEIRAGKLVRNAIAEGYKNAMSAIVDANITTFLTALILFVFGTGPIQGFATTLMIGIVTSFFTAVFLSRIIIEYLSKKDEKFAFGTKMTEHFMENININFLGKRKIYYIVVSVVMLVCFGSLATRGLSKGIDFTGGQIFVVRFDETVSTVEAQAKLAQQFEGATVEVKTFGRDNQIRIATNYGLDLDQDIVETKLYEGLKDYAKGADKDTFLSVNRQSSEKVGPTMASDITEKAIYAIVFSLIVMFLYIFVRFRKWAYGASAVVALAHDVIFTLGVFSLCYSVMPFSMEIDQSFIAAILTIVGYSINNTVVIFDRVRETFANNPKSDPMVVINQALNSTMARTFNTSITTLVTLVVILIFGGEVVRGFVFAMTTGIFIGTFSSVLLATPLAYTIITSGKNKKK